MLARTRVGEGGGGLASSLYTIPTGLEVFQDRRQQVPSRKSSPMTDDAVASWHRFIMILLLITICQFSLAQPVCHFSLSPVELPVPLSGARGPPFSEPLCHGHCHLLGFPGRVKPAQSLQLCGWGEVISISVRSSKDPVPDVSHGRAMREVDLRAARHCRGTCCLEEERKGAQVAWRRKRLIWD